MRPQAKRGAVFHPYAATGHNNDIAEVNEWGSAVAATDISNVAQASLRNSCFEEPGADVAENDKVISPDPA